MTLADRHPSGPAPSGPLARVAEPGMAGLLTLLTIFWASGLPLWIGVRVYAEQILISVLCLAMALCFLARPANRGAGRASVPWYDKALAGIAMGFGVYLTWRFPVLADEVFYRPVEAMIVSAIGLVLLLEALRHLRDLDYRCVLVGSDQGRTAYRRELEALITRNGLAEKVSLLDECRDMPAAYMLSDVVVSASTDPEGFGRIVGEAQALGRPVVASDHGGAREQLVAERTGFLFPVGDAEALAASLRKALELNPEARARLHDEAIARVRQHFSKDQMCAKTIALYKEVLRAGARAPGAHP